MRDASSARLDAGHTVRRGSGLTVDPRGSEPLYRQIFDQIVERVRSGAFPPGYRLPPTRDLAVELGAHRNTVVRAYADLEAAGFVTSTVGRGTFVNAPPPETHASPPPDRVGLPWASLLAPIATAEPLGRSDRLARMTGRDDFINMTRMQPSADLIPDELFRRCIDHVLRTLGPRALGYGPREGLPRLRGLIAEDLARQGVPARAEDIIVTTGSQQALDLCARALVAPGDAFLVDSLTYGGALNVLVAAGARLVGVAGDDDGPSLASLARLADVRAKGFYLIPHAHNPTGVTISARRREALVAWSHARGVPLIEDDYGAELNLDGVPALPAMRALDGDVLHVGTFSKKLIPALRIGFVVCPPALRAPLVALKHALDLGTSLLLQHALAEFLERGYLRAHLGKVLPEYRERRDALCDALTAHLPQGFGFRRPDKGICVWIPLPPPYNPEEVTEDARRRGVLVGPSTLYALDPREQPGIRLTYCAEPADRLREGARRLGKTLAALAPARRTSFAPAGVSTFEVV